eukprot:COSAG01_NODE_56_length_31088_cov_39.354771_4_plen_185_part_00
MFCARVRVKALCPSMQSTAEPLVLPHPVWQVRVRSSKGSNAACVLTPGSFIEVVEKAVVQPGYASNVTRLRFSQPDVPVGWVSATKEDGTPLCKLVRKRVEPGSIRDLENRLNVDLSLLSPSYGCAPFLIGAGTAGVNGHYYIDTHTHYGNARYTNVVQASATKIRIYFSAGAYHNVGHAFCSI